MPVPGGIWSSGLVPTGTQPRPGTAPRPTAGARRGASTVLLKNVCVKSSSTRPGLGFILLTQLSKAPEHPRQLSRYEYVCIYKYRLRSTRLPIYNPKNNIYVFKILTQRRRHGCSPQTRLGRRRVRRRRRRRRRGRQISSPVSIS